MQSGGFGRKGLEAGAPYLQRGAIAAPRFAAPDAALAAKRAAFLAEERNRNSGNGLDGLRNAQPTSFEEEEDVDPEEVLRETYYRSDAQKKSMLLAYVLWFFAGPFSAHRFYLGQTSPAIKQVGGILGGLLILGIGVTIKIKAISFLGMVTMGLAFFWILADAFFIPSLCRKANDASLRSHKIFD